MQLESLSCLYVSFLSILARVNTRPYYHPESLFPFSPFTPSGRGRVTAPASDLKKPPEETRKWRKIEIFLLGNWFPRQNARNKVLSKLSNKAWVMVGMIYVD